MNGQQHTEEKLDYSSETYKTAWAKSMMGKQLSAEEDTAYKMVNEAFTHTTGNTGTVIPKVVTAGIWQEIGEIYPYWNCLLYTSGMPHGMGGTQSGMATVEEKVDLERMISALRKDCLLYTS